jgi:hypothetical protein
MTEVKVRVKPSERFRRALARPPGRLDHVEITVTAPDGTVTLVPWAERRKVARMEGTAEIPGRMAPRPCPKAMEVLCPEGNAIYGVDRKTGKRVKTGGYRPLFSDHLGEAFRVGRVKFPKLFRGQDDPQVLAEALKGYVDNPKIALAYAEPTGLVLVEAPLRTSCPKDRSPGGWLGPWKDLGLEVENGPKVSKRLKTLTRGFVFERGFPVGEVALKVLSDDEHPTRLKGLPAEARKKLLDGAFLISRSLADWVIDSVGPEHTARWERQRARGRSSRLHNARLLVPRGTPGCPEGGLLKGNAVVVDDQDMPPGASILTHPCNLKPELRGWKECRVALEPQPPLDQARYNLQLGLSLPQLFPPEEVRAWVSQEVYRVEASIREGRLLDTFERLADRRLHGDAGPDGVTSTLLLTRWTALDFFASGHDFRHSPALTEGIFRAHTAALVATRRNHLGVPVPLGVHPPIPCAVTEQVVSESLARLCGLELDVKPGTIRRVRGYGFAVVSDADWLEMLPSHGGCDMDDHFVLAFRTVNGARKVIVLRNPSDVGEYSVFDHVPGDDYPTFTWRTPRADGGFDEQVQSFPEADLTGAPKRTSDALKDGSLRVLGLPAGEAIEPGPYTRQAVVQDLERVLQGTNPGVYVNAKMVSNTVFGCQPAELPATLEEVIDACVQGGSVEAMNAVRKAAKGFLDAVCESGEPVDDLLWQTRGDPDRVPAGGLYDGALTQLVKHAQAEVARGRDRVSKWAQAIHVTPPALERYRTAEYPTLRRILKDLRSEAFEMSRTKLDDPDAEKARWEEFHRLVLDLVTPERVGLFALVVHETPTSVGRKITDGLLLNREVFAHYLAALTSA